MKKRIASIIIAIILMSSMGSFAESTIDTKYIRDLSQIISENYIYELKDNQLTEGALKGMFGSLDPYSAYYTAEEYKRLLEELTGEISQAGIGVRISRQEAGILIEEAIKGNPAELVGIKKGDIIISVDDIDVSKSSVDEVSALIRGQIGKPVKIGIKREGKKETLFFNVIRKTITINPVEWRVIDKKTAYIKISEFNDNASRGVKAALAEFDKKNISNIVFDVRDNPGGYLSSVLDISSLVISEGIIVYVKDSKGSITSHSSFNSVVPRQLMVLVNKNSASASEIFAGAVQDRGAGKVVGTRTYGKGTVQDIIPLERGGAVKLTVAEYFTPKMKKVNKIGIIPDIEVKAIYKEGKDPVLEKALKSFKK